MANQKMGAGNGQGTSRENYVGQDISNNYVGQEISNNFRFTCSTAI